MSNGPTNTHGYRRLQILQSRFQLNLWLNSHVETAEVKYVPHTDFCNARKVDNHVHHSSFHAPGMMSILLLYSFVFFDGFFVSNCFVPKMMYTRYAILLLSVFLFVFFLLV